MPKPKHSGQTSITLWILKAEAASIDAHVRTLLSATPWARSGASRQQWILSLVRRELGAQQSVQPEPPEPPHPVLPVCTPDTLAEPGPPRPAAAPAPAATHLDREIADLIRRHDRGAASGLGWHRLKEVVGHLQDRYRAQKPVAAPAWAEAARKAAETWRAKPGRSAMVQRLEKLLALLPATPSPGPEKPRQDHPAEAE